MQMQIICILILLRFTLLRFTLLRFTLLRFNDAGGWARSGLFRHPERLTPEFGRRQQRLVRLLGRQSRAGHLDCPHCGKAITADDLEGAQPSKGE